MLQFAPVRSWKLEISALLLLARCGQHHLMVNCWASVTISSVNCLSSHLGVIVSQRCLNWLHTQAIAEIVQDKADGSEFRVAFWRQDPVKILAVQTRFFRKARHPLPCFHHVPQRFQKKRNIAILLVLFKGNVQVRLCHFRVQHLLEHNLVMVSQFLAHPVPPDKPANIL